MSLRRTLSLFLFFLKTIYFSPVNNPSFFVLSILVGIYFIIGGIGKHEVLLIMLAISASNRLMPAFNNNSETEQFYNPNIVQYSFFLPIRKNEYFLGFFLTGAMYVFVLLGICFYIGINVGNPPTIPSLCPTQTITEINQISNETYTNVNGIILLPDSANHLQPVQFQIPITPSIVFGDLASKVIFKQKVSDSVFHELCIPENDEEKNKKLFDLFDIKIKSEYYSEYLTTLPKKHNQILLMSLVLCLVVFILDQINIYNRGAKHPLMKLCDTLIYCSYVLIWIGLFIDLLLPESKIFALSSFLHRFNNSFYYGYILVILFGLLRISFYSYYETRLS